MQLHQPERVAKNESQAFRHVAIARVRSEGVEAEVRAAEGTVKDLAYVDHADDLVVLAPAHEERFAIHFPSTGDVVAERLRRRRRRHPSAVELLTRAYEDEEPTFVPCRRSS